MSFIKPYHFDRYKEAVIKEFAVPPEEFSHEQRKWLDRAGSSLEAEKDFLWNFCEQLAHKIDKTTPDARERYQKLRAIYLLMWGFLIGQNRSGTALQTLTNFCDLKLAELSPFKTTVQIIGTDQCTAATRVDGMVVSLEDALIAQPIPYPECTRPLGCICCYGIHGVRDLHDRLVIKNTP
jgi:hypothetical protein